MKRSVISLLVLFLAVHVPANSQSKFIKNVAKDVKNEILGSSGGSSTTNNNKQPEPSCACNQAEQLVNLDGLNVLYSEITIDMLTDGSFLLFDRITRQYYIVKDGVKKGPYDENSSQVAPYLDQEMSDDRSQYLMRMNKDYISKSGDKYTITFNGKAYGPYAMISNFVMPRSHDKFAALVTENIVATEDQGKQMEDAIKKAKTEQEKMELAMKFSQEMQQRMMAGGGPTSIMIKLVTSVPNVGSDQLTGGYDLDADMKYDEILVKSYGQINDLNGNKILSLKPEQAGSDNMFINAQNTRYAWYDYGTLSFSDGTSLTELFSPHLLKSEGKTYLAYLYYSPAKNAIMRCKILF